MVDVNRITFEVERDAATGMWIGYAWECDSCELAYQTEAYSMPMPVLNVLSSWATSEIRAAGKKVNARG